MRFASLLVPVLVATAGAAGAAAPSATPFIPDGEATSAPRGFVEMCGRDATFCGPGPIEVREPMVTAAIVEQPVSLTLLRAIPAMFGARAQSQLSAVALTVQFALDAGPAARLAVPRVILPALAAVPPLASADGGALLRAVNHRVNGHVTQMADERRYGRDEYWARSGVGRGAAGDCEDIAIEKRYELLAAGFPADRLAFAVVYLPRIGLHTVLIARTGEGDMVLDSRSPYVERWDRTRYSWVSIQAMGRPMAWHGLRSPRMQYVAADGAAAIAG